MICLKSEVAQVKKRRAMGGGGYLRDAIELIIFVNQEDG